MILQVLTQHYEDLLKRGDIAAPGWGPAKISFALCLNADGELMQVIPTMREVEVGKKTVLRPQEMILPAGVKRAVGIASNFLWDKSAYLLGVDQKGKSERSRECFAAAATLHHTVLDGVASPFAHAVLNFFDTWDPDTAPEHPALQDQFDQITAGGNLVFWMDGRYPQEEDTIRSAWQRHYDGSEENTARMQCLVTGQLEEIAAVHPSIKGVRDAQSSGAALVSFNAPAFCSYGHVQNFNAPVGKYAAFAYTAALNHLLAERNNVQLIGDTTVVCWAEGAEPTYQSFSLAALFGQETPGLTNNDLRAALKRLADGLPCDDLGIDPNRPFNILGLAPNAARLSVRFFLRDTFGNLMKHVNDHYERLEIIGAKYDMLPLWALLQETVRRKTDGKSQIPSPAMAGATARAIFSGGPYPAALLEDVMLRIRAERNITCGRAAILKAYLMRNIIQQREHFVSREVADVELNENCTYMPYVLGRLFCVMEQTQLASADWSINRTIKDSYFTAAASTPQSAFYKLFPLNEHHMKKLMRDKPGLGTKYSKLKTELTAKIAAPLPVRFTQEEMISFYLGYYHQKENKKEDKDNG